MQEHRRRLATQRSPATPISPKGGGGTASISLSLHLHAVTDIASSSLRDKNLCIIRANLRGPREKRPICAPNSLELTKSLRKEKISAFQQGSRSKAAETIQGRD